MAGLHLIQTYSSDSDEDDERDEEKERNDNECKRMANK